MFLVLYLLALAALAVHAPPIIWQPGAREFVIILGLFGAWRYSWGAVHLARALIYRHLVFPDWRRAAERGGEALLASQVYVVITSYRIRGETTIRVYQAACAGRAPASATAWPARCARSRATARPRMPPWWWSTATPC